MSSSSSVLLVLLQLFALLAIISKNPSECYSPSRLNFPASAQFFIPDALLANQLLSPSASAVPRPFRPSLLHHSPPAHLRPLLAASKRHSYFDSLAGQSLGKRASVPATVDGGDFVVESGEFSDATRIGRKLWP